MSSNEPNTQSKSDQRRQAREDKAVAKANRNWFRRHKFLTFLGVVVVIIVIIVIATSGGGGGDDGSAGEAGSSGGGEGQDAAAAVADQYGTFDPVKESGDGDSVIDLPGPQGIITATHDGSENFTIEAIDDANQSTGDLPVNTIGSYEGTTAYGLDELGDATRLKVTASGPWTLTVEPVSKAPTLSLPEKGSADAVFLYDGDAATWTITHSGGENIAVTEYGGIMPNLMVNEIGSYEGDVPADAGPAVVTVVASGDWSISAK